MERSSSEHNSTPTNYFANKYRSTNESTYNPHIHWAIVQVERRAQLEAAGQVISAHDEELFKANAVLIEQAQQYIQSEESHTFLDHLNGAVRAIETGDMDSREQHERALHETGPIPTAEIRALIAFDSSLND